MSTHVFVRGGGGVLKKIWGGGGGGGTLDYTSKFICSDKNQRAVPKLNL